MPNGKKLIPATMGLDQKGERSGNKGLNWLTRKMTRCEEMPTREQVSEWMAHIPPETLAVMAYRMLNELGQSILVDHELNLSMALLLPDEEFVEVIASYRAAAELFIERIRALCHTIKEAVAWRAADGWPEWDYETGREKNTDPAAPAPHVELDPDIEAFLLGALTRGEAHVEEK